MNQPIVSLSDFKLSSSRDRMIVVSQTGPGQQLESATIVVAKIGMSMTL
jgi:hypothetical protein